MHQLRPHPRFREEGRETVVREVRGRVAHRTGTARTPVKIQDEPHEYSTEQLAQMLNALAPRGIRIVRRAGTLLGLPVYVDADPSHPPDVIRFVGSDGREVGRVVHVER